MPYCLLSSSSLCLSGTGTSVVASLADNHSLHSTPHQNNKPDSKSPAIPKTTPPRTSRKRNPQQPTIIQIERAIGAGMFRDSDPKDLELRKSVLDGVLPNFSRKFESPVERTLREFGERITTQSESRSNSSGNRILMFAIRWVLPIWVVLLFVASGVIKLPFSIPYVGDLIM